MDNNVKISQFPHLDKVMERLHENKKKWVELPLSKKISYLENIRKNLAHIADDWTKDSLRFKGTDPELPENAVHLAFEYINLVPLGSYINSQLEVLKKCKQKDGHIKFPEPKLQENTHVGRQYLRMFPKSKFDTLLQPDFTIDVWLDKDKPLSQGKILEENKEGKVCVILGGGNVNVIPPADALHKLFVENQVVIMKYNPVNASTGFWVDKLFSELIEDGFYYGVGGETEPGAYLVDHKLADTLHMTGSDATYNRIVWGHPSEWKERQLSGNFCNKRYFSCELGCVSPWMIFPGSWKEKSLKHQAKQLSQCVTFNNGFVCASPKVAIIPQGWKHKEEFLGYLKDELEKCPSKPGYYKGAHFRHQTFINKYKDQAILIKPKNFKDDHLEWVVIPDIKPLQGEYAFVTESFSPLICFMELPDSDTFEKYNENVAEFCNNKIWGTLSCTMVIPDEELKEHEDKIYKTIDQLKYGTVSINIWAAQSYGRGIWGGAPGTGKPEDIQSGIDFVFNPYLIDNLNKTVCRSPIISDSHGCKDLGGAQLKVMSRLAHYNIEPSNLQFTKILTGALAGL